MQVKCGLKVAYIYSIYSYIHCKLTVTCHKVLNTGQLMDFYKANINIWGG